MKIGGMGHAILRVTKDQLKDLGAFEASIFVRTVEACGRHWEKYDPDWYHDDHPFYFRIQHRYLPRTPDRGPLMVFTYRELLIQFQQCAALEEEKKGKRVSEEDNSVGTIWVDD